MADLSSLSLDELQAKKAALLARKQELSSMSMEQLQQRKAQLMQQQQGQAQPQVQSAQPPAQEAQPEEPSMLSQLGSALGSYYKSIPVTPANAFRMTQNAVQSVADTGEAIARLGWGDKVASADKAFSPKDENFNDQFQKGTFGLVPYAAGGEFLLPEKIAKAAPFISRLLAQSGAMGAHGAVQFKPGDQGMIDNVLNIKSSRTSSAIEDAAINALLMGTGKIAAKTPLGKAIFEKIFGGNNPPGGGGGTGGGGGDINAPKIQDFGTGKSNIPTAYNQPRAYFGEMPEDQPVELPDFLKQRMQEPNPSPLPTMPEQPPSAVVKPNEPQIPPAPQAIPQESPQTMNAVKAHISGGKDLTESRKAFAKNVQETFAPIVEEGTAKYDKLYKAPEFVNEKGKANTYPELLGDEASAESWEKDANPVHQQFVESPTLKNAQESKNQLASEARYYEYKMKKGERLTPEEYKDYSAIKKRHDALETNINDVVKRDAPHLKDALQEADDYWRDNVAKWYFDKDLYKIAKGNISNPSSNQIKGIFANPEEDALHVANKLGEAGKRQILHHAVGKTPEEFGHETVAGMRSALDRSGHKEYITPQLESHLTNYEQQTGREAANAAEIAAHGKAAKAAMKRFDDEMKAYDANVKAERDKFKDERIGVKDKISDILRKDKAEKAKVKTYNAKQQALEDAVKQQIEAARSGQKAELNKGKAERMADMVEAKRLESADAEINKKAKKQHDDEIAHQEKLRKQAEQEAAKKAAQQQEVASGLTMVLSHGNPLIRYGKGKLVRGLLKAIQGK